MPAWAPMCPPIPTAGDIERAGMLGGGPPPPPPPAGSVPGAGERRCIGRPEPGTFIISFGVLLSDGGDYRRVSREEDQLSIAGVVGSVPLPEEVGQ